MLKYFSAKPQDPRDEALAAGSTGEKAPWAACDAFLEELKSLTQDLLLVSVCESPWAYPTRNAVDLIHNLISHYVNTW